MSSTDSRSGQDTRSKYGDRGIISPKLRWGLSETKTRASKTETEQAVVYTRYELSFKDRLREGAKGIAAAAVIAYTFYRSLTLFLLLGPLAAIAFPILMRDKLKEKRLWELKLQFKEAIWMLSGYLSAGLSVENAFETVLPELRKLYGDRSMIAVEFGTIVRGVRLNKPIEPLLQDFALRSGLPEIRSFAEVFAIAKRSGGSLKEIIERTGSIIRDETEVSVEIKNLTASRRYEQRIMNLLPFGIIIYINVTSGGFMTVMYESLQGRLVMTVCLGLIALSCYLSQRILDIRL